VIKNTSIIKDVWIGSDAYIKGANKLKNLTINSLMMRIHRLVKGCELVNGIIGYGCRAFYGVKAVRFIMASHSQLKYGARLINSYLGYNSTISCCEVLNSFIFPAHEQHHNNSFLCAAMVMGQSNMAAGATIGSNHNSRAADGEIVAGRGFWPGLCVSLKHNSRFASFILIAKGDYTCELDISIPFSLVSNDTANDKLVVMPAYWFMYNMYALARNAAKYVDRDKRNEKIQHIEYDFLAPDTINEIFDAIALFKELTGKAYLKKNAGVETNETSSEIGERLLQDNQFNFKELTILADALENNNRPAVLVKVKEAFHIFQRLIVYYGITALIEYLIANEELSLDEIKDKMRQCDQRILWKNIGGQLIPADHVNQLINDVRNDKVKTWDAVHEFYQEHGNRYHEEKLSHALASLLEIKGIHTDEFSMPLLKALLEEAKATKEWMFKNIQESRAKDYQNRFRKMIYDSEEEMNEVIGKFDDNTFIKQQKIELELLNTKIGKLQQRFS
jgi:hypothetical protein